VREMGQSAWLSTLFLTLQGSEGRVNTRETEAGCNEWISWNNKYSVWLYSGRGWEALPGKRTVTRLH